MLIFYLVVDKGWGGAYYCQGRSSGSLGLVGFTIPNVLGRIVVRSEGKGEGDFNKTVSP